MIAKESWELAALILGVIGGLGILGQFGYSIWRRVQERLIISIENSCFELDKKKTEKGSAVDVTWKPTILFHNKLGKDTTIYELTLKCVDGLEVTKKVELSLQTDKTERETYNFKLGLQYLKIKGKLIITHTHNEIEIPVFREFRNEKDECPIIEALSGRRPH